jgi:hypothetical protein
MRGRARNRGRLITRKSTFGLARGQRGVSSCPGLGDDIAGRSRRGWNREIELDRFRLVHDRRVGTRRFVRHDLMTRITRLHSADRAGTDASQPRGYVDQHRTPAQDVLRNLCRDVIPVDLDQRSTAVIAPQRVGSRETSRLRPEATSVRRNDSLEYARLVFGNDLSLGKKCEQLLRRHVYVDRVIDGPGA